MERVLAMAFMALIACRAFAIPYAEESEIVGHSGVAEPGALQWHRDTSGAPFLSIGTFEGSRDAVRDRDALHRVPCVAIEPPDYSIALGDGVTMSNGWFVLWSGEETQGEPQVREISLAAAAGWEIVSVEVADLRADKAFVEVGGGGARIYRQQNGNVPGFAATTDCAFGIVRVLAVDSITSKRRDNLTMGDYLFTDAIGDCSLGTLREWALGQHRGHMAEDWSRYPAIAQARLADNGLVFDQFSRFHTVVSTYTNQSDTLTLYAGSRPALSVLADVGNSGSGFRILGLAQEGGSAVLLATAIGTNVTALCADVLSSDMTWRECQNVTVDYNAVKVDGVDCWRISFPLAGNGCFWRARTTIANATAAAVRIRAPLVLEAPDGGLWRLQVGNDGTLTTEAWQ